MEQENPDEIPQFWFDVIRQFKVLDADAQEYRSQNQSSKANKELQKLPPHLRQQYKQYQQQKPQIQGTRPISHPSVKAGENYSGWRRRMINLYKHKEQKKKAKKGRH